MIFKKDQQDASDETSELLSLLGRYQDLSKTVKLRRSDNRRTSLNYPCSGRDVPSKITCDRLVELYLRTFEKVFRVLHVPTFLQEYEAYWSNTLVTGSTFYQKLLLVMAIGTCFYYGTQDEERPLRSLASKWIYEVQQWLVYVFDIAEPNMNALQISCLLLLARQTDTVGSELIWISADFPLRIAISQGFNKEPSVHFPDMPVIEAEMRKRLWATILEISLQLSLDSGMPPPISCDDFDCGPPSNIDDAQVSVHMEHPISAKPLEQWTQTSIQIMLVSTMPLRLRILRSLTTLKGALTYQDALKLGSEIEAVCRSHLVFAQSCVSASASGETKPTQFQIKLLDTLIRRFILALHGPFAAQGSSDLSYYFSKRVVAETSVRILLFPLPPCQSQPITPQNEDYTRLKIFGGGIFKHALWHATASLCAEIISDMIEDSFPLTQSSSRPQMFEAIQKHVDILERRAKVGDTNMEAYMLFSCALAFISTTQAGKAPEVAYADAAKTCLRFCCTVLEAEAGIDAGQPLIGDHRHSRGAEPRGADDGLTSWDIMVSRIRAWLTLYSCKYADA